jgi:hypothetical protein
MFCELSTQYSREEIVKIVKIIRLHFYNRGLHCGARAIRKEMEKEEIQPIPSESTIGRILSRHGLTHGRTDFYNNPV